LEANVGVDPGDLPFEQLTPSTAGRLRRLGIGDVELDLDGMSVRVAGERIDLTHQEFAVLQELMDNAGKVLDRKQLLDHAWGRNRGRRSNTMSVVISRLRRKLRRADGADRIRTVRGVGYIFDLPDGVDQ
jgi:DNA-binding response OmpR family regulator